MGDSLEVRISTVEHIQEEFGHDIQEMKGQLAKLIKLIEGHTAVVPKDIHGSPFNPLRSSSYPLVQHLHSDREPQIPVRGNVPPRVHHPNWQLHAPTPAISPDFKKASQSVDHANSSENNLGKLRRNRDKKRWDPIPVTYTELLPRLLEKQLVALSPILPIRPPFLKSYNSNVHCDYHMGTPGHSTKDCISLKKKVQTLIEVGKINFKNPNQPNNLPLNFFGTRTEEVEEVAITSEGVQGRKTGYTSEKMDEEKKASELQKENEKLRRLVQDMAYMMTEQKESIAALRRGI